MKPISPEMKKILASRDFVVADCHVFSFVGGGVARYCGGDRDLTLNGVLYPAGGAIGPYFDRKDNKAKLHQKIGVEVDTLVIDCLPGAATIFGAPFIQACHTGLFDGATYTLYRCYMSTYGDTRAGAVRMFDGRVGDVDVGRSLVTFSINSWLELLNQQFPRNVWQPGCVNSLYDSTCQVNPASFQFGGTVSSVVSSQNFSTTSIAAQIAGYFGLGKVTFTSGVLNGLSRSIQSASQAAGTTQFQLLAPFPSAPQVGDTFNAFPGCNKSDTDPNGCPKFSNTGKYRGEPFVPQSITAL